ncbi:MAG: signal peptidase II [Planctomycetes bacterium]|nr:signal peptidase II [Planctomycetota bacterium]
MAQNEMENTGPEATSGDPAGLHSARPAWRSPSAWALLIGVIVVGLGIDLASKYWAFSAVAGVPVEFTREQALSTTPLSALIPVHQPRVIVPSILNFTLVLNPGAVFGIGAGRTMFFIVVTIVAVAFGLGVFVFATRSRDRVSHIGLGLILAGGLGNLYDRLVYGCVRDFIHPLPKVTWWGSTREVWPYVSNVADLFLLIGIAMLLWHAWAGDRSTKRRVEPAIA